MPRIQASSVVENRDLRRTALLDAAYDLLRSGGAPAVTMSAAAAAAGLSRPAAYEYFPSSEALLAATLDDQAAEWTSNLEAALRDAADVATIVRIFVDTTLRLVSAAVPRTGLSDQQISRLQTSAGGVVSRVLEHAGVPDPHLAARIMVGAVVAGFQSGAADDDVAPALVTFLISGLDGISAARFPR